MDNNLPELCYSRLVSTGEIIIIKRGEKGYHQTDLDEKFTNADLLNKRRGITKQQEQAMVYGSMFSWDLAYAKPENWNADGSMIKIEGSGEYI
jgi:hypothetical protein